jgi:predicted flap endonuclease-1-like 5' DNA nuclease
MGIYDRTEDQTQTYSNLDLLRTHMTDITVIEGIGPAYAEKLAAANITTCEGLLESGASAAGRKSIVEASGLSDKLILK